MFSILQKPQDNVNAEDLETLQNEIERRLVDVVTERWKLEKELETSNHLSPDTTSQPSVATTTANDGGVNSTQASSSSSQPTCSLPSGKLRNSLKSSQIDSQSENASDGLKGSIFLSTNGNNNGVGGSASGANSNDTDSLSSESSLTSNLTGSTIITANLGDFAVQSQQSSLLNNSTSIKRGLKNSTSDRPSKRFRQNSSNSLQSASSHPRRPPNSKHRSKIVPSKFRHSTEESRPNKKQIVKNEAPDKLWPFFEQFCAAPTEEQMKGLEEMIRSMGNDEEYYKIPESMKKDAAITESPTKDESSNMSGTSTKKKSKQKTNDGPMLGALTQRLVSSFIAETDDNVTDASKSSSDTNSSPTGKKRKSRANKGIDLNNAKNLEKRIRQQLEEHSILSQQDDIPFASEEDENLRELLVYQHELLSIQRQNKLSMQILLKKAKRHIELEKEREKLKEANADVIAAYQRLIQAKQRKRNPTKKEKDAAWRALKIQDVIFKKCDELYLTGLDRNNI